MVLFQGSERQGRREETSIQQEAREKGEKEREIGERNN